MITIVRVRFDTNQDLSSVWGDDVVHHWMEPLREFGMANFWWRSLRGRVDLDYELTPPVVMTDPRPNVAPDNESQRTALVTAAVTAATTQVQPNWADTDILFLIFAQRTDLFGGGTTDVSIDTVIGTVTRQVRVAVMDVESPFDMAAQEVGHAFGLSHERAPDGVTDYGSPYSVMSSAGESGRFVRDFDQNLPDGRPIMNPRVGFQGVQSQRVHGPVLAGAQLVGLSQFAGWNQVLRLGALQGPQTVRLHALNYQDRDPAEPPVLVTFPAQGRTFVLELRRRGFDYDRALLPADEGVVVHSVGSDGLVRYEGVAPLTLFAQQTDWACPAGDFALRLTSVEVRHEFVDLELRPGARRSFPIRGVLLLGRFRTQHELNSMTHDDMRNTLITEIGGRTRETGLQAYDNDTLAGAGAALVFLRHCGIRSDADLRTMSVDDIRNTLIVELDSQTGIGRDLHGYSNLDLVLIGLGSGLGSRVLGFTGSWIRGDLLAGRFRTQHDLNLMSVEDQRNTLITELAGRTRDQDYQRYANPELEGLGGLLVAMRHCGIRSDEDLKKMSADDMRNTLIVELDAQTGRGNALQGLSNLDLVSALLGYERA